MSSKLNIFRMALGNVGSDATINAPDENTPAASRCREYYDAALVAALEGFDWDFARTSRQLNAAPDDVELRGWTYAYKLPPDCVKARKLKRDHKLELPAMTKFEEATHNGEKIILCNKEIAVLTYTFKNENVVMFTGLFVIAMSWALAAMIAVPMTRDLKRANFCQKEFERQIANAAVSDANKGENRYDDDEQDAPWIAGR